MVGPFELAFRIAVTLVVIAAPALCFVGMWRGLDRLRDDALVARLRENGAFDPGSSTGGAGVPATIDGGARPPIRCRTCGTSNVAEATYCHGCLEKLPG